MNIDTKVPVVLFRSENYPALGITRSLGRIGIDVYCIDRDPHALAMKSRYCTGKFYWDDTKPPQETIKFLINVAEKIGRKAILLPNTDARNLLIDQHRHELAKWYLLPQPENDAMNMLYSKKSMYEISKAAGIPTAETIFPDSIEEALEHGPKLDFPLMIKAIDPDRLMHRTNRRLALVQEVSGLRDTYSELDEPGFSNLCLQEYIPGNVEDVSWAVAAYFDKNSKCRFAITAKKLRQLPIHGGVTTLGACTPCEAIVDSISRIAKATGYHGIIDSDFIYDGRDGLWKLLDVNPRNGANFRLFTDKNGLDVVRSLYLDLTNQNIPTIDPHWGRRWLVEDRDFEAFRDYRRKGSLTLGSWLGSLRGVSELAHFSVSDLRPSISFFINFISYYVGNVIKRILPFLK